MIKLMKSAFYNEEETKRKLCDFIMSSRQLSMGEYCAKFEKTFSEYQGRRYGVLFNSGSSANFALIHALINLKRINKGESVGFSSLTWATNVSPLLGLGLDPVPIDIDVKHLNISSENLINSLQSNDLKVLFLTNLLGFCGDIGEIQRICTERGILLIEDNCESLGSEFQGKKLGNFGFASTFSFFVGHHLSTIEGGMVCTDDKSLCEMLKIVRAHGWVRDLEHDTRNKLRSLHGISEFFERYTFYDLGYNLRPTEITGFLGMEQLKYVDEIHKKRKNNFERFMAASKKNPKTLDLNLDHMSFISNFAFPVFFDDKISFDEAKALFERNVEIRPIVGGSIVEQPFFKKYMLDSSRHHKSPNAKKMHEFGFYIPNNPELTDSEIEHMAQLLSLNNTIPQ